MWRRSRLVRQDTLTVVTPLSAGACCDDLQELFEEVQAKVFSDRAMSGPVPFGKMASVHFARFAICDAAIGPDGRPVPASLLFSTEYDGSLDSHLDELVAHAEKTFELILGHCDGFEAEAGSPGDRIRRFLKARRSRPGAFYVSALGRTVAQIRKEQALCKDVRNAARSLQAANKDPVEIWRCIRERVHAGDWGTPDAAARRESRSKWREREFWGVVAAGIAAALFLIIRWPWLLAPLTLGAFWLRLEEQIDADRVAALRAAESQAQSSLGECDREKTLSELEDRWEQNQLTVITWIAPSPLRRVLQRLVLVAIDLRARLHFTRGLLDGVPTIHFGHWHVLEGGRRLLFVSNYDGSWASYLDAFTLHAAEPMNAIWSHSVGFPQTRFLIWGGAYDGPSFKAFARRHQVAPSVWYSAYPDLSAEEINRNSEVIAGLQDEHLGRARHRRETEAWLRKI